MSHSWYLLLPCYRYPLQWIPSRYMYKYECTMPMYYFIDPDANGCQTEQPQMSYSIDWRSCFLLRAYFHDRVRVPLIRTAGTRSRGPTPKMSHSSLSISIRGVGNFQVRHQQPIIAANRASSAEREPKQCMHASYRALRSSRVVISIQLARASVTFSSCMRSTGFETAAASIAQTPLASASQ